MESTAYSDPTAAETGAWSAPTATAALDASVQVPGSKSLSNRELVLSALAAEPSVLRRPLHARDTQLMQRALEQLGTRIDPHSGSGRFGPDLVITPAAPLRGGVAIDCGLAGTVMRFLPPIAALAQGEVDFDGDAAARRRPMSTTIDSLRALGITVHDEDGALPFRVDGTGRVAGGRLRIDASASSQFVSGLLLAAPRFTQGLVLSHSGERLPSLPHIDMTLAALQRRGVDAERVDERSWRVAPGPIAGIETTVEPDLSNAEPFLIAAIVAGGAVAVEDWPEYTTQAGAELERILPRFGAHVERRAGALRVSVERGIAVGAEVPGVTLDLGQVGELAPNLAALCALCTTPSLLTGIGHLRGHETDRLAAIATELGKVGARVTELPDGLRIEPGPLRPAAWSAYDDHRLATSGAIVGLAVPGLTVDDIGATAKTLPEFPKLWSDLVGAPAAAAAAR